MRLHLLSYLLQFPLWYFIYGGWAHIDRCWYFIFLLSHYWVKQGFPLLLSYWCLTVRFLMSCWWPCLNMVFKKWGFSAIISDVGVYPDELLASNLVLNLPMDICQSTCYIHMSTVLGFLCSMVVYVCLPALGFLCLICIYYYLHVLGFLCCIMPACIYSMFLFKRLVQMCMNICLFIDYVLLNASWSCLCMHVYTIHWGKHVDDEPKPPLITSLCFRSNRWGNE